MAQLLQKAAFDVSVCYRMSLIVFFVFVFFSALVAIKRLDIAKPLRVFGVGLALCDFIVLVPILHNIGDCGEKVSESVSSSIMSMVQLITIDVGYDSLMKAASEAGILPFFTILCVFTPLVWGGVVLTLFESFSSWITYQIFSFFIPVYIFSDLNENSLMLAKSIKSQKKKKCLCIFCGISENISPELKEEAKENVFLLLKKNESSCIKSPSNSQIYFEISEEQNENLTRSRNLIQSYTEKYGEANYSNIRIYLFSEQEEAPLLLSSTDKKGIPVILVDRDRFFANDLLFTHPLYEVLSESEKCVSVLFVGSGKLAQSILRTAVWCGQLGKTYLLKISVIDKNADFCEKSLRLECPEFFNGEYDISFYNADVETDEFKYCLDAHCSDVNYICVCSESDELNIHTALYLRSYYFRKNFSSFSKPFIALYVKDGAKNAIIPEFTVLTREKVQAKKIEVNSESAMNYNLYAFGGDNTLYSAYLLDSPLEKLALNVHFGYELSFSDGKASEIEARKVYYSNETNIRSNRANALHIRYKLFLLGYDLKTDCSEQEIKENEKLSSELKSDIEKNLLALSQTEHDRWNAFMRSEGWGTVSLEQAKKIGKHKITRAKLHACLCSWEELDSLSEFDPKFKEYDEIMIKNIPYLLGLENNRINISGVRYALTCRGVNGK
ncbi:MAG: hypothetical protein IJ257_00650 [Treponema sp.]|nr:hypothetical protein [Treponema sp.]